MKDGFQNGGEHPWCRTRSAPRKGRGRGREKGWSARGGGRVTTEVAAPPKANAMNQAATRLTIRLKFSLSRGPARSSVCALRVRAPAKVLRGPPERGGTSVGRRTIFCERACPIQHQGKPLSPQQREGLSLSRASRPPRQPTPAPAPAMAAPGTARADPRASSVSRVATARNVGVSDVLFFYSDTL